METWNCNTNEFIETPKRQIKFIEEIEAVCKKYDLSISHEDGYGAFQIDKFSHDNIEWLKNAHINWIQ